MPAFALVGVVVGLDLIWDLLEGSTGSVAYRFVAAALISSVAIDVDHIPSYLGADFLTGSMPRPYTHGALLIGVLLLLGWATSSRRLRQILLGIAFGVSSHFLRDLATGPGVGLLWPLVGTPLEIPYPAYAAVLLAGAAACLLRRPRALAPALALTALLSLTAMAAHPPTAEANRIAIGAYIPNHWKDPGLIDVYTDQVGRPPAIVLSYKRWDIKPFHRPELRQITRRGAVPMVSWEPWNSAGDAVKLRQIARGRYDAYLRRSAREARAWGKPIMLRFAHEMNGSWDPWGRGVPGGGSRNFVAAWKRLVTIFRAAGADNVLWVWCPNVNTGKLPFMQFYPGDAWVDWVGLDGFNWGGSIGWRSFSETFAGSYEELAARTSKPILIAETGSGEEDGDKAAWVRSALLDELPNFELIRAVVWFNSVDRSDFRVASSPTALAAFREGIAPPHYGAGRAELLAAPQRVAGPVEPIPLPSSGYGEPSLPEELWRKLNDRLGATLWPLIGLAAVGSLALVALLARRRSVRADA